MRKEELILGTVFLVMGAVFFLIGQTRVDNAWYSFPYISQAMNQGNIMRLLGVIFFIVGFVLAVVGAVIEQKHQPQKVVPAQPIQPPSSSQQVEIQQPTINATKMKEIDRGESMFDRETFLGGIMAIGMGIVMLILIIWIEPLIDNIVNYQWIILVIRLAGAIFILIGIVGIIAAFLPKKEEIQIEQEQKIT